MDLADKLRNAPRNGTCTDKIKVKLMSCYLPTQRMSNSNRSTTYLYLVQKSKGKVEYRAFSDPPCLVCFF